MTTPPIQSSPSAKEELARKKRESDRQEGIRYFSSATTELLFVLLPFIVIGITLAHRAEFRTILFIPEWSIVSAVIVGQSIVKLASASVGRINVKREPVILVLSVLLVCLLAPILVILSIALTSPRISITMALAQAIFFALSAVIFWSASVLDAYTKTDP
jgi:hypothetical protein